MGAYEDSITQLATKLGEIQQAVLDRDATHAAEVGSLADQAHQILLGITGSDQAPAHALMAEESPVGHSELPQHDPWTTPPS